ncbi:little elongation complex subunit 2 [Xenentodon cancila]
MEMMWDEHPAPDGPFFTRDLYEKHCLTPHIRELWAFLQSPVGDSDMKQECDVEAPEAPSSPSIKDAAESKDNSCISSQVSCWESFDSDDSCEDNGAKGTDGGKNGRKTRVKKMQVETGAGAAYPEPRQPFPCLSSLSSTEQNAYVGYLMRKKTRNPPQRLKTQVDNEVMQFMKYLQDVSKMCADDYNLISQGAMQYSEEFFRACLEHIKTLPQFYQIHEMTSLTGGTFNPGLSLTFEKQLLAMGSVNITDHKIVPADAQLASDYPSVSSENPPAKKAKDVQAMISNDGNAEKLCACYEPHVCLTRDALLRLLDNHGPDFGEQWELPLWVKVTPGKVSNRRKTVYIDSPLLKTEMTVRERSHIYHQESLKLSVKRSGSRNVFHLMTELPVDVQQLLPEGSKRSCVAAESNGLDFEVDLTDLETFGETTTKASVRKKVQNEEDGGVKSKKCTGSPRLSETQRSIEQPEKIISGSQEEMDCSLTNVDNPLTRPAVSEAIVQKTEPSRLDSAGDGDEQAFAGDSDDEKLVIDDSTSPAETPSEQKNPVAPTSSADPPVTLAPEPTPVDTDSSSPHKGTRSCRQPRRAKVSEDQLGEILRMQTAMFKSSSDAPTTTKSPTRSVAPFVHAHPTSLVKPCVTSYLERHQNEDGETSGASHKSAAVNVHAAEHKWSLCSLINILCRIDPRSEILSIDLQACAEDEQDYEAPAEGNLFYKLYSLHDLLLMVRSSVFLTHTRNVGSGQNQHVPVHVLPKLEYQLSYGVECLTSSEACQLWTETLLHSSTASYIAHINAHTSEVALLRQLPDDWKQSITCEFKPSKSLNILHHLLKKLTVLEEGQYLIVHKAGEPFVTLLKSVTGKVSRGAYNLQQVHGSAPLPPTSCHVPWVPVDPAVVLPFHSRHGRVPCTFPPKPCSKTAKEGTNNYKGVQSSLSGQGNKKKSKQKKRKAKRDQFIKKLIKKSV